MATYRIALYNLASHTTNPGVLDISSLEVSRFSCSWVLNGPGSFEAEGVLGQTQDLTDRVGARQVMVFRTEGGVETAIWGGYLTRADVDNDSRRVRLSGNGFWSVMRDRLNRTLTEWTSNFSGPSNGTMTKSSSFAWRLIDDTQALTGGQLAWKAGTHTGNTKSMRRYPKVEKFEPIARLIEDACEDGYGDFYVEPRTNPNMTNGFALFRTWNERGTNRATQATPVSFDGTNTMTLNYSISSERLYTVVDVISNLDPCNITRYVYSATSGTPSIISQYGRREASPISVATDVKSEIDQVGTEFLTAQRKPILRAEASYVEDVGPAYTAYDIGDTVRVYPNNVWVPSAYYSLRVVERELTVEDSRAVYNVMFEERTV